MRAAVDSPPVHAYAAPMRAVTVLFALACLTACSASSSDEGRTEPGRNAGDYVDDDKDGFAEVQGDCNDGDKFVNPDQTDWCDGVDNNCDGRKDELADLDRDGWATCKNDCNDGDASIHPQALETVDGIDTDCDTLIDNHTPSYDDDKDGFSEVQGDCDDNLIGVGPGALEVQVKDNGSPEGIDNNCNGMVDEPNPPCVIGESEAQKLAGAAEICVGLTEAAFPESTIDTRSRGVFANYGNTYVPKAGGDFLVLSTGIAGDAGDPGFVVPQSGTAFTGSVKHPDPQPAMGCSSADGSQVNDLSELTMKLKVPTNVNSLSFDFNFLSAEFPEYVCSAFDDTFLALLDSESFKGNVSFDSMKNRVSVNVGFFDQCDPALGASCKGEADLIGTGYEGLGGGTGWLTTTTPVTPGETLTLRFVIFDEGDHVLDSAVIIDNFRWGLAPIAGPITIE